MATALRASEWVAIVYFTYAAAVALMRPIDRSITWNVLWLNATVVAAFFLMANADSLRRREFLGTLRDWYPLPLLLAYREMGWFALPHTGTELEQSWVAWDRLLLNDWGLRAAMESLGPALPGLLEISYALVYATAPGGLGILYATGHRKEADRFLFTVLVAILGAYVLFPFFPSEPPRTVFPGEDLPGVETVFRRFNLWYLGGYGIHTSVFPSAHVSGAFSAAFAVSAVVRERKWVGRGMVVLAGLIAVATVYGRYHYAVDGVAGFLLSLVARQWAAYRWR